MYDILRIPNPKLRQIAQEVSQPFDTEMLSALCASMYKTIITIRAVGLAAPQVGVNLRLVVMRLSNKPYFMVNPEITHSIGSTKSFEGCLSVPGFTDTVTRSSEVTVKWLDLEGNLNTEHFVGLNACIIQHEIDHLEGKLFIDYLPEFKRTKAKKKVELWTRRNRQRK